MDGFSKTFRAAMYKLARRGDRILVAVSGGMDSIALLYALNDIKHEFGLELVVAHFDHALRKSSRRDCSFVQRAAKRLGLRCIVGVNKSAPPKTGSIEEFARNKRYDFLVKTAHLIKADAVLLAHHEDDLAETVLLRILRGSGLLGLKAMTARRVINGVPFLRPFLSVSRKAIETYVRLKRLSFVKDPTNDSELFFRNKVRHKLLPYLEKNFAPQAKPVLAQLARNAALDYSFIETEALKAFQKVCKVGGGLIRIDLKKFQSLHLSLRYMVLRCALERLKGDLKALTSRHIQDADDFIVQAVSGSVLQLPHGLVIKKHAGASVISL